MKKIVVFFLGISLLVVSCGPPKTSEEEGKKVFKYNEPGGITSLDPAFARNIENVWPVNQLFNGLVQMDAQLKIQPSIAKSWEISED